MMDGDHESITLSAITDKRQIPRRRSSSARRKSTNKEKIIIKSSSEDGGGVGGGLLDDDRVTSSDSNMINKTLLDENDVDGVIVFRSNDESATTISQPDVDKVVENSPTPPPTSTRRKPRSSFRLDETIMSKFRDYTSWSLHEPIYHTSSVKAWWDFYMGMLMLYMIVTIPLQIAFDALPANAVLELPTEIITDLEVIARIYRRRWLWLDSIAVLPLYYIARPVFSSFGYDDKGPYLLGLLRVLRLFHGDPFNLTFSLNTMRLLKVASYLVVLSHWLGCAWYYLSDFEDFSGRGLVSGVELSTSSLPYRYLISFHRGLWALTSQAGNDADFTPVTELQAWWALTCVVLGVVIVATVIGTIQLLMQQTAASELQFQSHLSALHEFFKQRSLPPSIQRHVLRHTHHLYRTRRGHDLGELLKSFPREVQHLVHTALYKKLIISCPLFVDCEEDFVDNLCSAVRKEIALRGDVVVRQGALGGEMYIISKGVAEALDLRTKEVYEELKEGTFFGEIALFAEVRRTVSVRARTYMELLVIPKDDFLALLEFFPEEAERFTQVAKKRLANVESVARSLDDTNPDELETTTNGPVLTWTREMVQVFYRSHGITHLSRVFADDEVAALIQKFGYNGMLSRDDEKDAVQFLLSKYERLQTIGATGSASATPMHSRRPSISATNNMESIIDGFGPDQRETIRLTEKIHELHALLERKSAQLQKYVSSTD